MLALSAFMSSLSVKGRTMSSEANEHDQQFEDNETLDIGKSERLRKEGNATINKVSAMRPGLAKIIEKVRIWRYFESPESKLHISENACCIDYADTLSSKQVHWLSNIYSPHCTTTRYGCQDMLEVNIGVAWARLPITRILPRVALESQIQRIPTPLHNTGWMDHCQVCDGCFEGIQILDTVDFIEAYGYIASYYHSIEWHVQSYGWRYVCCS